MKPEIDWIEISDSKFVFGLSKEQKESVKSKIWDEHASGLDQETQRILINILEKREKKIAGTKDEIAFIISNAKFSALALHVRQKTAEEEVAIKQAEKVSNVLIGNNILVGQQDQQAVQLSTFYISRYPITSLQLEEFLSVEQAQNIYKSLRIPNISDAMKSKPAMTNWHLADLFCQWIGARLPTETEWEKSARGTDGRLYPWGNEWNASRGNFILDDNIGFTPVDRYPPGASPYGVMDMAGNTYEWTSTISRLPKSVELGTGYPPNEVWGDRPVLKSWAVKHGGAPRWFLNIVALSHKGGYELDDQAEYVGFRPVKDQWEKKYWSGW